jgi:hypothetical protein
VFARPVAAWFYVSAIWRQFYQSRRKVRNARLGWFTDVFFNWNIFGNEHEAVVVVKSKPSHIAWLVVSVLH